MTRLSLQHNAINLAQGFPEKDPPPEVVAEVLRAIQHPERRAIVRGQYAGYRSEDGVAASSDVETFAALRFDIDSWRWAGVPFFVRTGKCLPVTATEVMATFKRPPQRLFDEPLPPRTNYLRFRLGPDRVPLEVWLMRRVRYSMQARQYVNQQEATRRAQPAPTSMPAEKKPRAPQTPRTEPPAPLPSIPALHPLDLAWNEIGVYPLLTAFLAVVGVYFAVWLAQGGAQELSIWFQ